MKVLVIDDEVVIRNGMVNVLPWDRYDYDILEPASSGEEAIIRIVEEKPEIIISDIQMQGMTGLELIAEVAELNYPKEIIVLSGYDEFEYVQEAIKQNVSDYLLKTSSPDEILESVNKARKRLEETKQYLELKESKSERSINSRLKRLLRKPLPADEFNVLLKEMPALASSPLQLILINAVTDYKGNQQNKRLWKSYLYGKWLMHAGQTFIIVPRNPNLSDDYVLNMAAKKMSDIYNEPLLMSKVITDLNELYLANEQVQSLTLYKWLLPGKVIINVKKAMSREGISLLDQFKEFESNVLTCVRFQDEEKLKDVANEFIDWAFNHPEATPDSIARYIQNLYFSAVRYVGKISDNEGEYSECTITEEYYSSPTASIVKLFTGLLHHLNHSGNGAKKYVIEAIEYMTIHLNQPITLQEVASHVHVHPNYLGEMIRKRTGKSYLELLTDKRMERAEEYIVSSDFRVNEIASLVGYSDRKYFTKIFKRYYSMTPSKYRKENGM